MALELTEEQVKAGWTVQKLGDIARVVTGGTPSKSNPEYWGEEVPFLTPSDQQFGVRLSATERFLSEEGVEGFAKKMVPAGAAALTCIGATIGKISWTKEPTVTNQQINSVIAKTDTNGLYLYYKLSTCRDALISMASGSATPIVSKKLLESLEVQIPPRVQQDKIAEVLGSLDDKIEANNALIESLEQLADAEFLRLLKLHEDSIEDAKYGDLAVFGGGTPSTKKPEYWEGGVVNWVTPTDVTGLSNHALFESSRKITDAGLGACSSVLHPAGSILMTSRASIGFFAVNEVPASTNQGFIVVEPENADVRWWVYHHMKRDVGLFLQLSNGATFMELSRGMFKSLPLKLYRGKTALKDIHDQITSLAAENRELVETRDLLIRKLIK